MDLRSIPPQPGPGLIHVVVEVPAGGRNTYEYLPSAGLMALDRVLHPSVQYPFDYGFVPNTLAEDGSPLDAMVVMEEPSFPGCLILTRAIGLLELLDAGIYDGKLLCVPAHDPHLESMVSISQLSLNRREEIAEFFRTNRGLDGRTTEILGWQEGEAATALVEHCINSAAAQAPPRSPGPGKFAPDH